MYFIIIEYSIRHVQCSTDKTQLVILIFPITTDSFSYFQSLQTHSHISNHYRLILISPITTDSFSYLQSLQTHSHISNHHRFILIITNSFSFSSIPNMQIGYGVGVEKVLSSLVKDERFVCLFVRAYIYHRPIIYMYISSSMANLYNSSSSILHSGVTESVVERMTNNPEYKTQILRNIVRI